MIKLFSLGKKKEERHEPASDDMLFAELQKIKEEIEKGSFGGSSLFGELGGKATGGPSQLTPSSQATTQQVSPLPPPPTTMPQQQASMPLLPPPTPSPQPQPEQQSQSTQIPKTEPRAEHREEKVELYIKIDHYERVLDILDRLKLKLKDLEHIINELKEIKDQENTKLEEMRDQLENAKENINDVLSLLKQ